MVTREPWHGKLAKGKKPTKKRKHIASEKGGIYFYQSPVGLWQIQYMGQLTFLISRIHGDFKRINIMTEQLEKRYNQEFLHVSRVTHALTVCTACWKVARVLACSVAKSSLTLCDPMACSPPGSSVHRISQARILEWIAIFYSSGSLQPKDGTQVSYLAYRFFTIEPPGDLVEKLRSY